MTMIACERVSEHCYNLRESFGVICVHCGCCDTKHPLAMWKARLEKNIEWLEEAQSFSDWGECPELEKFQRENIESDIKHYKDEIKKCADKISEIVEGRTEGV